MKKLFYSIAFMALALMSLVSCNKEREPFSLQAILEQPEDYQNGKSYLSNEHFILWDEGDTIAVQRANASGVGSGDTAWAFCATGGVREAGFYGTTTHSMTTTADRPWIGIFPAKAYKKETGELIFPHTMPYRQDAMADFTFGKSCFPMVAFGTGTGTGLGFHSVCGILRFQLYSELEAKEISYIEFKSYTGTQQLSGGFTIKRITEYNPYLTDSPAISSANSKITITGIHQCIGLGTSGRGTVADNQVQLLTFYLPLPAKSDGTDQNLTNYELTMTVHTTDNHVFVKNLRADIRRNTINKMPAIEVTEWAAAPNVGNGNVQMVGCGTKERPFQIYTYSDLVKARDAVNSGSTINGQPITKDTYFKVVRADITLNSGGEQGQAVHPRHTQDSTYGPWTEGFRNFTGHFICSSNHPTLHGIVNNSQTPLFESISSLGCLDSVTVRGSLNATGSDLGYFSPLCITNEGRMSNCVNKVNVTCNAHIAGICVENRNIITGCRNEANLTASAGKEVAGICLTNTASGTVGTCVGMATGKLSGDHVGGLVLNNSGLVFASYCDFNNSTATGHLGGIAYNNTGTVQNCYVNGSLTAATGYSVGGICNLSSGDVLGCDNRMLMLKGSGFVGGIVAKMSGSAVVRNCYVDGSGTITTNTDQVECGGLVGYITGGTIDNSYSTKNTNLGHSNSGSRVGGCVGNIAATSPVRIWNVYASFNVGFFGALSGSNVTINRCYSRNGSQHEGLTTITIEGLNQVTLPGVEDTTLTQALMNTLATYRSSAPIPIRYTDWRAGNHPTLSASK